jgi:hypothetical protein
MTTMTTKKKKKKKKEEEEEEEKIFFPVKKERENALFLYFFPASRAFLARVLLPRGGARAFFSRSRLFHT